MYKRQDTYYEAAKQWYEENGNLKIPKSYVTGAGLTPVSYTHLDVYKRQGKEREGHLCPSSFEVMEEV